MAALTRFGPTIARSALFNHPRHMATATASDPIQKIFVDKIRDFKSNNKGLDVAHQKAMEEEMARLKRVYSIKDENKLADLDHKFPAECNISLRDLDESKEFRQKLASGEYQKQLAAEPAEPSALLASMPEQVTHDLHLPPINKPDPTLLTEGEGVLEPTRVGKILPDYDTTDIEMTPEKLQDKMRVRFGPNMPTIDDDKSPERDVVNFPRQPPRMEPPATRFHLVPESWFQFFYPKTGLSGCYVFAGSVGTFLFSKEWLIMEHELLTGMTSTAIFAYAVLKYGPQLRRWADKEVKFQVDRWEDWRKGNIEFLDKVKNHYSNQLDKMNAIEDVYEVRHQDIQVQLETEHRNRLKQVHDDAKRRLNYLVAVSDSTRQIAYKNMVNWVISNSISSIGQKQESEALDNCIVNLRQLASKNANVI